MASESITSTEYIQHHLTNLVYGKLPSGHVGADGVALTQDHWTFAHSSTDIAA